MIQTRLILIIISFCSLKKTSTLFHPCFPAHLKKTLQLKGIGFRTRTRTRTRTCPPPPTHTRTYTNNTHTHARACLRLRVCVSVCLRICVSVLEGVVDVTLLKNIHKSASSQCEKKKKKKTTNITVPLSDDLVE